MDMIYLLYRKKKDQEGCQKNAVIACPERLGGGGGKGCGAKQENNKEYADLYSIPAVVAIHT
jgi:hypothetical protein